MSYLNDNKEFWEQQKYEAINIDRLIFRFYGCILKLELKSDGNFEQLVDFGCGRGINMSQSDIGIAKQRYLYIKKIFSMFKLLHVWYYCMKLKKYDSDRSHYVFYNIK